MIKSNERSRTWCLVLYPEEDKSHEKILTNIIINKSKSWEWGYINHEGEINEETDERGKDHTHIIIRFENAIWKTALIKELEIGLDNEHYLQKCRSYKAYLLYMIHFNYFDKIQYDDDEFVGTEKVCNDLQKAKKKDMDEETKIRMIFKWIDSQNEPIKIRDISEFCAEIGIWDVFRRSQTLMLQLIKEKNEEVYNKKSRLEINEQLSFKLKQGRRNKKHD